MNIEILNTVNLDGTPVTYQSISNGGEGNSGGGNADIPIIGDGKTYLYIEIANVGLVDISIRFGQTVDNGVIVDWGDGSVTQTYNGSGIYSNIKANHVYPRIGKYIISLNPINNCKLILRESIFNTGSSLPTYKSIGIAYAAEFGKNIQDIGGLIGQRRLRTVSFTNYVDSSLYNNICQKCSSLQSFVIPDSVTSITDIPYYAFSECAALQSIVIPDSVTAIRENAFNGCLSLANIKLSENISIIESYAFKSCQSLVNIIIPSKVSSIKSYAFQYCYSVNSFDLSSHSSIPALSGTNAFDGTSGKFIVPDALYDEWIVATNWSTYASRIIKKSEWDAQNT